MYIKVTLNNVGITFVMFVSHEHNATCITGEFQNAILHVIY